MYLCDDVRDRNSRTHNIRSPLKPLMAQFTKIKHNHIAHRLAKQLPYTGYVGHTKLESNCECVCAFECFQSNGEIRINRTNERNKTVTRDLTWLIRQCYFNKNNNRDSLLLQFENDVSKMIATFGICIQFCCINK